MFRSKTVWSPIEVDYLKTHRGEAQDQLCIALAKSKNAIKNKLDELDGKPQKATKKLAKRSLVGKREDLGLFMRSGWEANVARWMLHTKQSFQYEPQTFFFQGVKKGTVIYTPDFNLSGEWLEVKGMMDGRGRAAIRRFKKYYPEEFKKLKAVVGRKGTAADKFFIKMGVPIMAYYNELDKQFKNVIQNWE